MNYRTLFTCICLFCCSFAKAQSSDTLVYYMNGQYEFLDNRDTARYVRFVIKPHAPEKKFKVYDYYAGGGLKMVAESYVDDGSVPVGMCIEYFSDGKRQSVKKIDNHGRPESIYTYYHNGNLAKTGFFNGLGFRVDLWADSTGKVLARKGFGEGIDYINEQHLEEHGPVADGCKNGEWQRTINGKLKCVVTYDHNSVLYGTGYDSVGNPYPFTQIQQAAIYHKDFLTLSSAISNLKVPAELKKSRTRLYLTMSFWIETNGAITDIQLEHSAGYGIDEKAIQLVRNTDHMWDPAKSYGIPIRKKYVYSFPLNAPWY